LNGSRPLQCMVRIWCPLGPPQGNDLDSAIRTFAFPTLDVDEARALYEQFRQDCAALECVRGYAVHPTLAYFTMFKARSSIDEELQVPPDYRSLVNFPVPCERDLEQELPMRNEHMDAFAQYAVEHGIPVASKRPLRLRSL
jgi:hypothetical protein